MESLAPLGMRILGHARVPHRDGDGQKGNGLLAQAAIQKMGQVETQRELRSLEEPCVIVARSRKWDYRSGQYLWS